METHNRVVDAHLGNDRRWHARITDPLVLFPLIAFALLAVIAYGTYTLVQSEYDSRRQFVASSTLDLAQTYEAQVVRALREIDQTLKFLQYAFEASGSAEALSALENRGLLLNNLVFDVSITNSQGAITHSTRPVEGRGVSGREFFENSRTAEGLFIGASRQDPRTGEWSLDFGRRLDGPGGEFAGIAMVSVDPVYFVSSYEVRTMGEKGVLGILGKDGRFRVRRSGDAVSHGDVVDFRQVLASSGQPDTRAQLWTNDWDGVRRYAVVRELFGFPLAVVAGLSEREQMAPVIASRNLYLLQAVGGGLFVVLVVGVLGYLGWQLQRSRQLAVEEQTAHARQVEHLAYHDNLTGLPNRSFFSKLLSRSVSEAHRYHRNLSVLFLDLDGFKSINDTLGHQAGDELLQEVARRLRDALRESDTVARLGGDEFVVLLPDTDDKTRLSTTAGKILESISRPFILVGQEIRISASIGISRFPHDGTDDDTLMKNADVAMYSAKDHGKNAFSFYSDALDANSVERLTQETALRRALAGEEFRIHYQLRQNVRSGAVTGVEALLRWQHPERGLIPPRDFLPLATETNLIVPIGKWVLENVCRQYVEWRDQGQGTLDIAVNLSAPEFFDIGLVSNIESVVGHAGMDPGRLELEVTELVLLCDIEKAIEVIKRLKTIGVRIAVDNFGAGYSSLSALRQFQLDTIKVDGNYVRGIDDDVGNRNLIEGIITIARELGSTVVAEGVETRLQADYLDEKTCDEVQGFYFSEPVPPEQVFDLIRSRGPATPLTPRPAGKIERR